MAMCHDSMIKLSKCCIFFRDVHNSMGLLMKMFLAVGLSASTLPTGPTDRTAGDIAWGKNHTIRGLRALLCNVPNEAGVSNSNFCI